MVNEKDPGQPGSFQAMRKNDNYMMPLLLIGAILLISGGASSHVSILKTFLPSVEGFSAYPVWDYGQWSWGYGTAAGYDRNNKPPGSITRERAMHDMLQVIDDHYADLKPHINKTLNAKQMAALLSFSYNTGTGNAMNIIDTINTKSAADVVERMKKYVYADGVKLQGLVNRRKKETDLYLGMAIGSSEGVEQTRTILVKRPFLISDSPFPSYADRHLFSHRYIAV